MTTTGIVMEQRYEDALAKKGLSPLITYNKSLEMYLSREEAETINMQCAEYASNPDFTPIDFAPFS